MFEVKSYTNFDSTESTQTVSYAYDSFNRLVWHWKDLDGDGPLARTYTYYYHDGNQLHVASEGVYNYNPSHRYLWGPSTDQFLADDDLTLAQTLWPLSDHLNTPRDLATYDSQLNVTTLTTHRLYSSFGELLTQTGPDDTLFSFTARFHDPITSLQNNLNRWYDPSVGRWLSEDPISFAAGDANLYRYVENFPTVRGDPSGLAAENKNADEKPSEKARELEKILPFILERLKEISKNTKKLERFGVILKHKIPEARKPINGKKPPRYKFVECVSKDTTQMTSPHRWWGGEKQYGSLMLKIAPGEKANLDEKNLSTRDLNQNYPIEFSWHTHPPMGDPWPSTQDGVECKKQEIVGVMIRYIGRMRGGKIEDGWVFWIIDTDGKTYEYKPPTPSERIKSTTGRKTE